MQHAAKVNLFRRSIVAVMAAVLTMGAGALNADQVGHAAETLTPGAPPAFISFASAKPLYLPCRKGASTPRHGTAFRVTPTLLVTAAHVVQTEEQSDCRLHLGSDPVSAVYVDTQADLALVKTRPSQDAVFDLACDYVPVLGDLVIHAGFGRSGFPIVGQGQVGEVQKADLFWADHISGSTAYLEPGMSGGPTLNPFLRVVGVNVGARLDSKDQAYSLFVPVSTLCPILERYNGQHQSAAFAAG